MAKSDNIQKRIDTDLGLRAKRRGLVFVSIILLFIQFSGAKITEANTFLVKASFENPQGIGVFITVSIVYLLIRYYSYAKKYHDELFKLWSTRMLSDNYIATDPYQDEVYGLVIDLAPKGVITDRWKQQEEGEHYDWIYRYSCSFPVKRAITYSWNDEITDHSESVNVFQKVGFVAFVNLLWIEARYQIDSLISYRENLDIWAPYMIGVIALASYFFGDQFGQLIGMGS